MSLRLDQLLAGLAAAPATPLSGLALDSRQVEPGWAYLALPGREHHGLEFHAQARARGAVATLVEPPLPAGMRLPGDAIVIPGLRARLGALADHFFDSPSAALPVIGVTGTNGKTSVVHFLAQALSADGQAVGTLGTLGQGLHGQLQPGARTTPDVLSVHRTLARMRDGGAEAVAMEVSSHALDQGRVDAVRFLVAVFTNLSRDHLDYHGDMAAYGAAKARLFAWPGLQAAVINLDDAFGQQLFADLPDSVRAIGVSRSGARGACLSARSVRADAAGLYFELAGEAGTHAVNSQLLGRFNIDNLLAVAGVLLALGWTLPKIAQALSALLPVPGRMGRYGGGDRPLVVVDYAHTPDALEKALVSLRAHAGGRLWCVFGCGGERDRGKRPLMAAVAERCADELVITDDNPRGEDGDAIVGAILAGLENRAGVRIERDRAAAIRLAISQARPGDVVLVAGKGHETTQEVAGRAHPFDDGQQVRAALGAWPCAT